jgi:hypothetical protein
MKELFILQRNDRICQEPNRERPKKKSTIVNEGSVCIKFDERLDIRYPMSYVMWTDSMTGEIGFGWVLSSRLRSIHLI